MPIFGAERGYNTEGDVLVNATADGVDLNAIWREQMAALAIFNEERTALARLMSYPTTQAADAVPQSLAGSSFERASEFGVPQSNRVPSDVLKLGYTFEDHDLASRYTWKFLRDSTADQVAAIFADVLAADNKLVNTTILNRLFDPRRKSTSSVRRATGCTPATTASPRFPTSASPSLRPRRTTSHRARP